MTCNENRVRILKTNDVVRVIAFIPPGHTHTRVLIETSDGDAIVLQQASVDALIRAYVAVALHPQRVACELTLRELTLHRKHGFARWQLVESARSEDEVLRDAMNLYLRASADDETRATNH